jgi:uncharacterized protein YjbI with pentapeptide repeats
MRGELSMGHAVHEASCHGASFDRATLVGVSFDGARFPGIVE